MCSSVLRLRIRYINLLRYCNCKSFKIGDFSFTLKVLFVLNLISKFLTLQPGQQTIATHILPNISRGETWPVKKIE